MSSSVDSTYRIENLTTGYNQKTGAKTLVSEMSACLLKGELTCLIGVNGAGKSTLLRTLAGLQPVVSGKISLCGKHLKDYTPRSLSKVVSVVLTDEIPEQNLTAFELVSMGRIPYTDYWGRLIKTDEEKVESALSLVGMGEFRDRPLCSLSDGEKQKLMIAKALAQDTEVILLDEPVAFLDFPSKVAILRLLSKVARDYNKSILLSIHDIELALQIAQRLWILTGENFDCGEPRELSESGKIDFLFQGEGISYNRKTMQYCLEKS